jgi:hypothetical protein
MAISVFDLCKKGSVYGCLRNISNTMGAGSSVVVECENVLFLSLG